MELSGKPGRKYLMDIQAFIWDLGGVLVWTEDFSPRNNLASQYGLKRSELEELVLSSHSGTRAQLGKISADEHWESITMPFRLQPVELTKFQDGFWGGDRLDESLVELVRSLRPRYKTALLSNAFSDLRRMLVDQWKIIDAFDEIIISSEVGVMKPDERIYKMTLERLNLRPDQAVFIDDFESNTAAADKLKLHTVHFISAEQTREQVKKILTANENERK